MVVTVPGGHGRDEICPEESSCKQIQENSFWEKKGGLLKKNCQWNLITR